MHGIFRAMIVPISSNTVASVRGELEQALCVASWFIGNFTRESHWSFDAVSILMRRY
jgi:hypothetical protein